MGDTRGNKQKREQYEEGQMSGTGKQCWRKVLAHHVQITASTATIYCSIIWYIAAKLS